MAAPISGGHFSSGSNDYGTEFTDTSGQFFSPSTSNTVFTWNTVVTDPQSEYVAPSKLKILTAGPRLLWVSMILAFSGPPNTILNAITIKFRLNGTTILSPTVTHILDTFALTGDQRLTFLVLPIVGVINDYYEVLIDNTDPSAFMTPQNPHFFSQTHT